MFLTRALFYPKHNNPPCIFVNNIIIPKLTNMIDNQLENLQSLREYLQQESCRPQEPPVPFGECCGCPQTQIING